MGENVDKKDYVIGQPAVIADDKDLITQAQEREASGWLEKAETLSISTQEELISADTFCKDIKRFRLKIEGDLKPAVEASFRAYKIGKAKMDEFCNPLKDAESNIKNEILCFSREQERIRLETEAKARREAEEAARKDKERLEKEAEEAAGEGRAEEFEQKAAAAEEVTVEDHMPVAQPTPSTPKGTTVKDKWKAEVIDLRALVKAVHEGIVPINAIKADEVYLGQRARSDKGSLKIPGVRVYNEGSVSIRT